MNIDTRRVAVDNARKFLSRVQLQGSEVPAFIEVMQFLELTEKEEDHRAHHARDIPNPIPQAPPVPR